MKKILSWICIYLITFFSFPIHVYAELDRLALPQGGSVVSGQVDINYAAIDRLNVNQSTNQAIVNWQSFNVGRDASVHFNQPGSKASILNNVLSGQSIINGKIFSNGRLFLVNPTGILTGPHSAIKAEGAILSTLNLTNQNFLNNNYQFNANSNSSLVNQGLIQGQYVALISPQVNNKGNIITSAATTIVAGDDVLLGISDSNNLTVKVAPSKLKAMAKNEGTIKTQNGIVTIKADAAQSLVDEVVKLPNARADGLVSENGVIKLISNSGSIQANKIKINAGSNGATEISGTLNSDNKEGKGGTIEITAKDIDVNSATISADGKTGGGKVLVGGDWQGTGELLQATYLNIDSNSKITANALTSGSGGTIVAWSDIKNSNSFTRVSGTLEAKGIDESGGQIETSGADLDINGIKIDTSSVTGRYGNWLVDPTNLTIDSSAAATYATNLKTSDVTLTADNTITLSSNLAYTGDRDSTLTFNATTTVLNANITSANGSLSLDINTALQIGASNTVITTKGGNVDINGQITATAASKNLTINAGAGNVTFSSAVTGASTTTTTTTVGSSGWLRQRYSGYFGVVNGNSDRLNFFNRSAQSSQNDTRIYDNDEGSHYSYRYSGYIKPNETGNWQIQVGADDSIIAYVGSANQSLSDLFTIVQDGQVYNHSNKTAYLWAASPGRHPVVYNTGTKNFTTTDYRPFVLYWGEYTGGAAARMQWKAPSGNWTGHAHNSGTTFYRNLTTKTTTTNTLINNLSITANAFNAGAIKIGGDLTVTNSGNSTISGVISGDTALTKAGSGQLTTSANNTYTGGTTVSAGTLFGGAGSRTNDVFGTGSISVASGATLRVDRSDDGALTNALTLNGGTLYGTNGFGQYWDGNITLGAHSTIKADNNFYIDGVISGSSKNLTKTGTGTVILRGTNTYSGTTTVSSGTLTIGGSGTLGSGSYSGTIANSGTFNFASSANLIASGVISGSGIVKVSGSGVFEPTATNTYTGGTVIDGGKIAAKTDRNFGANPSSDDPDNILLKNGGTIYFGSVNSNNSLGHVNFGYNNNRGIYLETGQHNFIDGSGGSGRNKIYSVISGVGGVTYGKIGNKTMTIYSANTYTGDTKFNYTTGSNNGVHIANADAWKYSTVYLDSTKTDVRKGWTVVSGGSINFGGLAGDATDWRWQNKQVTFGYNNQDTTFSGTISRYNNDGYDLVKVGTGTTTFSNTSSNAHQDDVNGINVQAGKVILSGNWGRNNDSNGNFNIESGATLEIDSSINNSFDGVLSGSGNLIINGSGIQTFTGTNTFSGSTTISSGKLKIGGSGVIGNATYSGTIANSGTFEYASSAAQTLSGVISGGGGLTKSGSGDLTLSGNSNTTGTISLSSGNLIAGSDNALGSAPTISASNTPTLKTSDGVTLPSLEVTGDIILETSVATTGAQIYNNDVQIKGTGYSLTSSGSNITISGDVAAWSNTGILQLRYNGSYIFNGGSAATANASSSTVGNGSLTYASGSYTWTKPSSTSSADLLIIAGGGGGGGSNVGGGGGAGGVIQKTAYSLGSSTYSVSIGAGGAGGLAHYDGGNGGNTEFGSLTAIGGGGGGGHSNRPHGKSGGSGGGASFWYGNPGSGTAGQGYSGAQETTGRNRGGGGGGAGGAGGQLNGEGTNGGIGIQSSITGTAQWYAGGGGAGTDGDTGNTYGGLIGGSGVGGDGGAARTAGNAAIAHTGSGGGGGGGHSSNRGGAGASGLVVISYSQASSSDLTINAAGAVTLSGAVSNFDFVNITNGETSSVAGVINGSGPLTKSGAGMLSLAGTNTYTGNTIVNAGTLRLSGSGSLGSGTYAGNITNNGIFRSVSSATQTLSGVISGTGRVDASGNSGALTLTGTNTYSGGARIASGGILVAGSGRALGSGAPEIRSTSTSDQFSVSSGVTLDSLKVTGAVRLNSGITTTGAQIYTSDVLVASGTRASPVEFNTTNSNIAFGGTLKGQGNSKARSITINAGTGNLEFGDRVGYAFNNKNYDANNQADSFYKMTMTAKDITIKGDVMTFEEQTYNGNVIVSSTGSNGTTRTLLSIDPKVTINGTVNDSISNTHRLVAKAVAIRRDGQVAATPEIAFNGKIGTVKNLAGYSGVTGYQVVSKNYGIIDQSSSFGTVTGGNQTQVATTQNNNTRSSQSNGRKTEKSANAVAKSAQTTIADVGKNLIATLFGGGPSGGGRTFSKSIEVVMPGDAGFNQPGPETGSGADFGKSGNNQSAPSFEPRGNNSIGGAPAPKSQGGNFDSTNQGTSSPKPRSIKELFSSKDFKNQFSSKQEMRQFKRQLRQEFKNNPGSRKSFNKALRDGFDPTDPKSFEKARPEEKKAFRKFKEGDDDPRKLLDKSKDRPDERGKGQDNNNNLNISEDDEEEKRSGDKAKTN